MVVNCPHCGQGVENRPDLANVTCPCPHCRRQFTLPAFVAEQTPVVVNVPLQRSAPPPRRQPGSEVQTWLLAGILGCGVLVVVMLAAWEMRFQSLQREMEQVRQQFQGMPY